MLKSNLLNVSIYWISLVFLSETKWLWIWACFNRELLLLSTETETSEAEMVGLGSIRCSPVSCWPASRVSLLKSEISYFSWREKEDSARERKEWRSKMCKPTTEVGASGLQTMIHFFPVPNHIWKLNTLGNGFPNPHPLTILLSLKALYKINWMQEHSSPSP